MGKPAKGQLDVVIYIVGISLAIALYALSTFIWTASYSIQASEIEKQYQVYRSGTYGFGFVSEGETGITGKGKIGCNKVTQPEGWKIFTERKVGNDGKCKKRAAGAITYSLWNVDGKKVQRIFSGKDT